MPLLCALGSLRAGADAGYRCVRLGPFVSRLHFGTSVMVPLEGAAGCRSSVLHTKYYLLSGVYAGLRFNASLYHLRPPAESADFSDQIN